MDSAGSYFCGLYGVGMTGQKESNVIEIAFEPDYTMPPTTTMPPPIVQLTASTTAVAFEEFEIECSVQNFDWQLGQSFLILFSYSRFTLTGEPDFYQIGIYYVDGKF